MSRPPLTRRQKQILDFFRDYTDEHGMSPTLEEVAQHFGVNKVTIFGHVAELERKGVLTRSGKRVSRGLQIVPEESDEPRSGLQVLGSIAAGQPIEAVETPEELTLSEWFPDANRSVFALRVSGESMIDDGIRDGDLVVVESRKDARDGEMVVAILEDEGATLKRLYREGESFRLQPANATMDPIYVDQLEVRGVVIGVVRRY